MPIGHSLIGNRRTSSPGRTAVCCEAGKGHRVHPEWPIESPPPEVTGELAIWADTYSGFEAVKADLYGVVQAHGAYLERVATLQQHHSRSDPPNPIQSTPHLLDVEPTVYSSPGPCLSFPSLQIFTRRCCGPHANQRCPVASSGVVRHLDPRQQRETPHDAAQTASWQCMAASRHAHLLHLSKPLPDVGRLPNHAVSIHAVMHVHLELGTGPAPLTPTHYPCDASPQQT
jgi:hypothetical protein